MNQKRGMSLVFLTAIISGISIFINKFGVTGINPYIFTFLKNSVVAVFLLSSIVLYKKFETLSTLSKKSWLKLVLIGLFGGSIPFLLFFKGLQLTSAASASFIHKTMFIWVSILSIVLLKNKLKRKIIIPAILLLIGNFLLLKLTTVEFNLGALLILIATLFWSFETILSKNALKTLDGTTVAFGRMFFGSAFILLFLAITGNLTSIATLIFPQLSWVLITSGFLFFYVFTYYNGLKTISPTLAASILLLGSPITTLLNYFILDISISLPQVAGIILIGIGITATFLIIEKMPIKLQSQIPGE